MTDIPPALPEGAAFPLDLIVQRLIQDSDFLEYCDYPSDDIQVLGKLQEKLRGASPSEEEFEEDFEVEDKWDRLQKESNKLFKMLTDFSSKLNDKDNTETMAYFRTATSLLDKIVGIQERTSNLKKISLFYDTVLRVMEDNLDAGQRTKVMEELRQPINSGA